MIVVTDLASYSVRRLGRVRKGGVTAPVSGTIDAIVKFNGPESEHCVYNELVAVRLAETLHVPIAAGVPTATGVGQAFASLELASPGIPLPDVPESQFQHVAELYPEQVAALVAFDLWIGNADRACNFKASMISPQVPLFRGFDHSHALLGSETMPAKAIKRLYAGELIVTTHPFFGRIAGAPFRAWIKRVMETPDAYVRECCEFGRPVGAVTTKMQASLASALLVRRNKLALLATLNAHAISTVHDIRL